MSYTTAQIIAWNEEQGRGIAWDGYNDSHRIHIMDVHPADRAAIKKGSRVLIYNTGFVEIDTASFVRFNHAVLNWKGSNE